MKIIENIKEVKVITFADLKIGDVFKLKNDKSYYMKTEKRYFDLMDDFDDYVGYSWFNAVCLSDGRLMTLLNSPEVIPVDCELIIK